MVPCKNREAVRRRRVRGPIGVLVALVAACALDPTSVELVLARTLYRQALMDGTAELAPAEMYRARLVLEAAERENAVTPGDPSEADLAYIARRRTIDAMRIAEEERAIRPRR